MNFIKRQLAIVVMSVMGFIALSGYFINWAGLRNFTDKDATNFYMIIAGFAAFLGCLNLLQLHLKKIAHKKENWQYSIFTLLGFIIMIILEFFVLNPTVQKQNYFCKVHFFRIYLKIKTNFFLLRTTMLLLETIIFTI